MSVKVPRWMRGPEKCVSCNAEAQLTGYRLEVESPDAQPPVLVTYRCAACHETRVRFHGRQHRETYLQFISDKVKAGELPQ